jgi:hypothetical protein
MPKLIHSPVKRFPGDVVLLDPLPLAVVVAWEEAIKDCQTRPCAVGAEILGRTFLKDADRPALLAEYGHHFAECSASERIPRCRSKLGDSAAQERMIPAIRKCVAEWKIPNFDINNPPGNPKISRSQLVAWLVNEINNLYLDEGLNDPNALSPEPMPTA